MNAAIVLKETVVASPFMCPEISLRLVTSACRWWSAREADLLRQGVQDPFWAFAWPGGQAMARFLLDQPEVVRGRRVLDFGAGSAIEGIAAMLAGAREVLASDLDPLALEAIQLNASLNRVVVSTTREDLSLRDDERWDVILAADVFYDRNVAEAVMPWLSRHHQRGTTVLLADPGRGLLPLAELRVLETYQAPADLDLEGGVLKETAIYSFSPSAAGRSLR